MAQRDQTPNLQSIPGRPSFGVSGIRATSGSTG